MSISNTLSFTLYAFLLSPPCDPISDLLLNKRMAIWSLFVNIISNLQIKIESLLHKIKIKIIPRVTFNRCWSILYHSSSKFVHSSLLDGTCHIHTLLSPISSSKLLFFFLMKKCNHWLVCFSNFVMVLINE